MITKLCLAAENDDKKPCLRNSVRRLMLRSISLLLRHELGNTEWNRIFEDVDFSPEDDTRELHTMSDELNRLLTACYEKGYAELATIIRLALQTSADRGVLLHGRGASRECRGLPVRDVQIWMRNEDGSYVGEVFLKVTKVEKRSRTVPITDRLCRELLPYLKGEDLDDPVFSIKYAQLDFPWTEVRKASGLEHLRFKDLRAQISQYGEEAGIPQTVLTKTYGHSDEAMTRRYQQRRAALSSDQAEAIEEAMYGRPENRKTA